MMAFKDDDEVLARQLQLQFDQEEQQEERDMAMARALAAGHEISDSESEEDKTKAGTSVGMTRKVSSMSEHHISDSDSDATDIDDPTDFQNANDNHRKSKTKRAKRKHSSSSDSDRTYVEELEEETKRLKGQKTKSQEKKTSVSPATKRLKKEDTLKLEDTQTSEASTSKPKCPYGSKCYRKNPSHTEEFLHPDKESQRSKAGTPPLKKHRTDSDKLIQLKCSEIVKRASPYGFILSKVAGVDACFNNQCAVHIRDILNASMGQLVASAHFNYLFDIPWLMDQYPKEFRDKPLLLVHGLQRESKMSLHEAASSYRNIKLCQAKLEMMYGTHHSKMMFLLYTNGMRVVIHTCNIIQIDWHQKTQGIWISPLFPKLTSKHSASDGESPTFFKRDLLSYLTAYKSPSLQEWKTHITEHDMSQAKVFIVASVPGRHIGEAKDNWGHLRVRKILKQHGPNGQNVKGWPVIGQFSSVGSLGADKNKWLCAEWLQSMASVKGQTGPTNSNADTRHMKLIFPTIDNVRTSLEGYPAGGSIPYSIQTAKKQTYFHSFLHQWKAAINGRDRASPHIKTYSRLSPDNKQISWFLVTSANMSKAAWGILEKNGSQIMIRSYEIGVMFLPRQFHADEQSFPLSEDEGTEDLPSFQLPWDVPLTPYSKSDRPWIWDIPYTEKPDSHGNAWVPGRR